MGLFGSPGVLDKAFASKGWCMIKVGSLNLLPSNDFFLLKRFLMETLRALITLGVKEDSRAALRCLELGESGSSTETFLLTGNLGDWKIGV